MRNAIDCVTLDVEQARETMMTITVSEDLNSAPRGKMRFCATLNDDANQDRGGFGSSERHALWSLAQQLGIHPGTIQVAATIERVAFR